jgi:nucleoside 2-deoxyribosyltransferase
MPAVTVYLAGKIRPMAWRYEMVPDLAGAAGVAVHQSSWPLLRRAVLGTHHYAGPFFVPMVGRAETEDCSQCSGHGCGHCHGGECTTVWDNDTKEHGYNDSRLSSHLVRDAGSPIRSGVAVIRRCCEAIARSDFVFAWIDAHDCYGTVAELGIAKALGKAVVVSFPVDRIIRDMWFILTMADKVIEAGTPVDAFRELMSDNPRYMAYRDYLATAHWKAMRAKILQKAGYRCQVCNAHQEHITLTVHHRTYERIGAEREEDLIALCEKCHSIFHGNGQLADPDDGPEPVPLALPSAAVIAIP